MHLPIPDNIDPAVFDKKLPTVDIAPEIKLRFFED